MTEDQDHIDREVAAMLRELDPYEDVKRLRFDLKMARKGCEKLRQERDKYRSLWLEAGALATQAEKDLEDLRKVANFWCGMALVLAAFVVGAVCRVWWRV